MPPQASDPRNVDSLLQRIADAIPTHQPGDEGSDVASSYEVIALLCHAVLVSRDFELRSLKEDEKSNTQCRQLAPRLPPQWNASFGTVTLIYAHRSCASLFHFKIDRMGPQVEVRGLAIGQDQVFRMQRAVKEISRSSSLPIRITLSSQGEEDRGDLVEKIRNVFISDALGSFVEEFQSQIVDRLLPSPLREGSDESGPSQQDLRRLHAEQEQTSTRQPPSQPQPADPEPARPNPPNPQHLPQMARPRPGPVPDFEPPGFEDEHRMQHQFGPDPSTFMPGRSPYNIGHDDLNPPGLGPNDPLRATFIGGGRPGMGPHPGGMSGMHPTFDDPLFTGQGSGAYGAYPGVYDPQVPPGARWDPTGPSGDPRFPGGRGGNPFGGGGGFGGFGGFGGGDII